MNVSDQEQEVVELKEEEMTEILGGGYDCYPCGGPYYPPCVVW